MASLKEIAGRPEINLVLVSLARLDQAWLLTLREMTIARTNDAIGQVLGITVGMHIDQARHKIGVRRARNGPQAHLDRPGNLNISLEHRAGIDQHILARLNRALIIRTKAILSGH